MLTPLSVHLSPDREMVRQELKSPIAWHGQKRIPMRKNHGRMCLETAKCPWAFIPARQMLSNLRMFHFTWEEEISQDIRDESLGRPTERGVLTGQLFILLS